jgi:hypothetical protein
MVRNKQNEAFIRKVLLAKAIEKVVNQIDFDKDTNIEHFSETYGIYVPKYDRDIVKSLISHDESLSNIKDMGVIGYDVLGLVGLANLLDTMSGNLDFYGCIVLIDKDNQKIPYNPLSESFMKKLLAGVISVKDDTKLKVFVYSVKGMVDNDVALQTVDMLSNISVVSAETIKIEKPDDEEEIKTLWLKAPSYWDDNNSQQSAVNNGTLEDIHLDQLHKSIQFTASDKIDYKDLLAFDIDMLINSEIEDNSNSIIKKMLEKNWMIELSVIDIGGMIVPAYGLFEHKDNAMYDILCATKHPNISSDGSDYCTGVNGRTTLKGISELSYGNLTSQLNSKIWSKNSLSIAKGFVAYYTEKFMSLEV